MTASDTEQPSVSGAELAENISVSALLFQAQNLLESLEAFTGNEYPQQTVTIARMFKVLARRAHDQLAQIDAAADTPGDAQARARDLGSIVHALNSFLRYLQGSDPLRTPPGIQRAISLLISTHGEVALGCNRDAINVLVRPQWMYNVRYIDIIHQFETDANCDLKYALDPKRELNAFQAKTLIEALWKIYPQVGRTNHPLPELPKHVAVLSFAGLDRDDVLLYPLLAHELGHFLDFASDDLGNPSSDSISKNYIPSSTDVRRAKLRVEEQARVLDRVEICLREIAADLLAARMGGVGYLLAFNEFFKTLTPWPGPVVNPQSGYPGFRLRLKLIFEELSSKSAGIESINALNKVIKTWRLPGKRVLKNYLARLQARLDFDINKLLEAPGRRKATTADTLIERTVISAIPAVQELVRGIIPLANAARINNDIEDIVGLIKNRIPPFQPPTRAQRQKRDFASWAFHEILTAGWLYQIGIGEATERAVPAEERVKEYHSTCLLLLKALELEGAPKAIKSLSERDAKKMSRPDGKLPQSGRGVISGPSIRAALDRPDATERLVLCPDLGDDAIESASRDLHLGHWFRISKRTSLGQIDIAYSAQRAQAREQGQSEVFVQDGGKFILQPGDFGLGVSLEYICLPCDMMAFVEGKSSLGRAGLLIATATQVAPGFKGCIVLELFNAGTVPIILRPAMRIAQLVLVSTDIKVPEPWLYSGSFKVQIKP